MVGELSEDGKWMWAGNEWIPAPPSSKHSPNVNLHDSVVAGDVNIIQNDVNSDAIVEGFKDVFVTPCSRGVQKRESLRLCPGKKGEPGRGRHRRMGLLHSQLVLSNGYG